MNKSAVRLEQKEKLKQVDAKQKLANERKLYQKLFNSSAFQMAKVIAVTSSLPFEVNTYPIIKRAWQDNKTVVLDKVIGKQMIFVKITPQTAFVEGPHFGILEPDSNDEIVIDQIDLVVVPGLAFRLDGARVGFGGGFYDRFLKNYHGKTVSLALPEQLRHDFQVESFDQLVQQVLTVD